MDISQLNKTEQTITTYEFPFQEYALSKSYKIGDNIILKHSTIKFSDNVLKINDTLRSVDFGCRNINIVDIPIVIKWLKGEETTLVKKCLFNKNNRLVTEREVIDITDRWFITDDNRAFSIESFILKDHKVDPSIITKLKIDKNSYYDPRYIKYDDYCVAPESSKDLVIAKLEYILELIDIIKQFQTI